MDVTIAPTTSADAPVLERPGQSSAYDFSEYGGIDVDSTGVYPPPGDDDTDTETDPQTFLIRVDGHLGGYATVSHHDSYFDDGDEGDNGRPYLLSNFFVMRKYHRRGVGEYVARTLFDRFPGRWEVATNPGREPAQTFWRRVIGRYTHGTHREAAGCDRWDGIIWAFDSAPNAT